MNSPIEPVALQPYLEEIITFFSSQAHERGNQLEFFCWQDPGEVYVDTSKLRQVILALLDNANRCTQEGEIELQLFFTLGEGEKSPFTFAVNDTGVGRTVEGLAGLVAQLSQPQKALEAGNSGVDSALLRCQEWVTLMGGGIEVKSVPDEGSLLSFTLALHHEYRSPLSSVDNLLSGSKELPSSSLLFDERIIRKIHSSVGQKVVDDVTGKMLITAERTFRELRASLAKEDAQGVENAVHLMKGAALHLGLITLSYQAKKMESLAQAKGLATIKEQVEPFEALFDRSYRLLLQWNSHQEKRPRV
jgi:HPt (histidine-containing phosphotransfer) domain-containing protein